MTRKELFDAIRPFAPAKKLNAEHVKVINGLADMFGMADGEAHALEDKPAFYNGVRGVTGPLDQTQVDVIEDMLSSGSHWPISWMAYGLATAWHEARLRPIEEIGKGKGKAYGAPGKHKGQIAFGRGLAQLTWDWNYATMDEALGLNGALIKDYSLALKPDIAVRILIDGMERGRFTGKSLATYLPQGRASDAEFREARRIINGTDKAAMIAGYAVLFQAALQAGGW